MQFETTKSPVLGTHLKCQPKEDRTGIHRGINKSTINSKKIRRLRKRYSEWWKRMFAKQQALQIWLNNWETYFTPCFWRSPIYRSPQPAGLFFVCVSISAKLRVLLSDGQRSFLFYFLHVQRGNIVFDRDGYLFECLLSFCRTGKLFIPPSVE